MPTTEHTINDALAALLRDTRSAWRDSSAVSSENSGMLRASHGQPDIIVIEPQVLPVAIETEVAPAMSVESEAMSRLGKQISATGRAILSSVAVRLPVRLRTKQGTHLRREIEEAPDLEFVLFTGRDSATCSRWPRSGWLSGTVADLSFLVQTASTPPEIISDAAANLIEGVGDASALLGELTATNPGVLQAIAEELRQEDGEQTRGMAATILANAFVFQELLAGGPGRLAQVGSLEQLRSPGGRIGKSRVLAEWRKILEVNYWPIFDIARRILTPIPGPMSARIIAVLADTADRLSQQQVMRAHDLSGVVFQRLITDRKFLAAYYTTPASAALLIGLAITPESPMIRSSWANAERVKALRIADFACGTGTLLSTAYQRVSQLHEMAGGDSAALHPHMMEHALVGCDILPAATHLTASMLAGAHPTVKYEQSSILTLAYGKQKDGGVALGSLDLLDPQGTFETLSITAKAAGGTGERAQETWRVFPDASFDVVVMNPPFTRATGHEGRKIGIPNPMFAAFGSSAEEQRLMSRAASRLTKGTSAHGNAGEASMFLTLADRKVRESGVLALVLPASFMMGEAWEDSRALVTKNYSDIVLVSISGSEGAHLSFSADTDMGECLLVARRSKKGSTRASFVVLRERPTSPLCGTMIAEQVHRLMAAGDIRKLEGGPTGGSRISFGDEVVGQALDAPLASGGWRLARVCDLSLAQTAYQMEVEHRVWLPSVSQSAAMRVPITTVSAIGQIGPYHSDVSGDTADGGVRGPFDVRPVVGRAAPTYPVLWAHTAARERAMQFEADSEGIIRDPSTPEERATVDRKVTAVWNTASHCHFNRDFRFNSQSTAMQFTPRRSIGGRAWISIRLASEEQEKALVAWGNTTLGLLMYWWCATKQQAGRGSIGKSALRGLPVLDVAALTRPQLHEAAAVFDAMSGEPLLPLHELARDDVRKRLDEEFGRRVLDLGEQVLAPGGPLDLLRTKLSLEPSIRGNKEPA